VSTYVVFCTAVHNDLSLQNVGPSHRPSPVLRVPRGYRIEARVAGQNRAEMVVQGDYIAIPTIEEFALSVAYCACPSHAKSRTAAVAAGKAGQVVRDPPPQTRSSSCRHIFASIFPIVPVGDPRRQVPAMRYVRVCERVKLAFKSNAR
jgi:hypothetical protein